MRRIIAALPLLFALTACGQEELPPSTFYDRTIVQLDGQSWSIVTRDDGKHFVHAFGRYFPCAGPNPDLEGCRTAIQQAKQRERMRDEGGDY
ncbi:MAG: hypothetical protein N4A53_08985 [Pelagimonas sp.]|jgi:hypothetical protein|nr:hypothetical protein [Pelagimonas sp.]